jgi:propionyl-CoA synthetase
MVREKLSPITCFHRAIVVPRLPKTRSGKILRSTLKAIANNDPYTVPATCEDPSVCKQIEEVIRVYETSAALKSSY